LAATRSPISAFQFSAFQLLRIVAVRKHLLHTNDEHRRDERREWLRAGAEICRHEILGRAHARKIRLDRRVFLKTL
jgi:hypothetical protein